MCIFHSRTEEQGQLSSFFVVTTPKLHAIKYVHIWVDGKIVVNSIIEPGNKVGMKSETTLLLFMWYY